MTYRSYPLMITTESRSSLETAEVLVHMKNLNHNLKNHMFYGNDYIKIFDFLTCFVNKTEMMNMSEAQAFIDIQTFMDYQTKTQSRTNLSGTSNNSGITCWPVAITCLLQT